MSIPTAGFIASRPAGACAIDRIDDAIHFQVEDRCFLTLC